MSDLRGFSKSTKTGAGASRRIIGAIVIAAVFGTIGAVAYQSGAFQTVPKPNQVVADSQLPAETNP